MKSSNAIPIDLVCEHLDNPLAIDELNPRLSWKIGDTRQGAAQTAYRIAVASSPELLKNAPDLWDTGKVKSDQSLDIPYSGKRLAARNMAWWRVQTWDHRNKTSRWSQPAFFGIGPLKKSDWSAKWIGRPLEGKDDSQPSPMLRRSFDIPRAVKSARIYVTARGLFELHLNGERVGEDCFVPGWTDMNYRIQYLAYDVTGQIRKGANALGAILGDGWYAGYLSWGERRCVYGEQLSLLLQLDVEYEDGTSETIATDSEWKTSFGPVIKSDIYNGETFDARRDMPGWTSPEFNDSAWDKAAVFKPPKAELVAKRNRPVRKHEELKVKSQTEPEFGVHVFDLGQNMVGWARIKIRASRGQCVRVRYAEMLNSDGTLYTENLRSAKSTDFYTCRGEGEETYEPRFTFHGFRYVELTGLVEKPKPSDVTGMVLHSEIPATGTFECSDPMVNQLQSNITWGQRSNFLEVPTDCPQRDERLGWTGDAQVFIRTACFNRDVSAFFTKWCIDMLDSQFPDGAFPHVVPNVIGDPTVTQPTWREGAAAWADAGAICPWTIYLCYGDKAILERHYKSMKKWVDWRRKTSKSLIHPRACFGDWLAIDSIGTDWSESSTPKDLIATAYFAYTTDILVEAAGILNRKADIKKYKSLGARIRQAFNREFVTPSGRVMGDSQTSYLLALGFDLLPAGKRKAALKRLVADIEERGCHLSTGFVGTPLLAPVLSRFGRTDLAYKLLMQETYPSWLYSIMQGATTMWERWNSYTKEHGFGNAGMNSFNHYAYGAIGEWLYNTVAGIELDPREPGYKHVIIQPQPGGGLKWARGELNTRYGIVSCHWKITGGKLKVKIRIPPNTHATVKLPGLKTRKIKAGSYTFESHKMADAIS